MAECAQFTAIHDETFILPDPVTKLSDAHFQDVDFLGLDSQRTAVLMFRLTAHGPVRLTMRFNSHAHCIDYNFDPPEPENARPRSWHEIVPGSDLKPANNELTIAVTGTGRVDLSDLVVLYHANQS